MSEEQPVFDGTRAYIKQKSGVVIPVSMIITGLLLFVGWTYTIDTRLTSVEVHVEHSKDDIIDVKKMVEKIHDHLLKNNTGG